MMQPETIKLTLTVTLFVSALSQQVLIAAKPIPFMSSVPSQAPETGSPFIRYQTTASHRMTEPPRPVRLITVEIQNLM